ncbi:hypothetical protein B4915_13945 [Leucobacter massiliensis]|uniref:Uncharacterized protein n=1 Tax=Leucobacter massiliensis TaxID=1686285 RepID=A0A2S9QKA2_9MICO|nr:hypothetical protein B4915_13945 [Leucobacter massiliensis]
MREPRNGRAGTGGAGGGERDGVLPARGSPPARARPRWQFAAGTPRPRPARPGRVRRGGELSTGSCPCGRAS